jgi:hypothetical protein
MSPGRVGKSYPKPTPLLVGWRREYPADMGKRYSPVSKCLSIFEVLIQWYFMAMY